MESFFQLSAVDIDGKQRQFSEFSGKVVLVVNVASKCGFTGQYAGLESLYRKYQERGLVVLGFPCNQFGAQEPGNADEIKNFCSLTYEVTFPMFAKIDVNGDATHPVYQFLKEQAPGLLGSEAIKWNFTKFLVSRDGTKIERFAPTTTPESMDSAIAALL